mgnify:CR=1 FL=1
MAVAQAIDYPNRIAIVRRYSRCMKENHERHRRSANRLARHDFCHPETRRFLAFRLLFGVRFYYPVFAVFFLNRLLNGPAEALASGADEALAYDSEKSDCRPREQASGLSVLAVPRKIRHSSQPWNASPCHDFPC